ncbi:MAG: glycosyltransferase family 4 protein [Parcubacteria group bacterium]|nr:glycosyltransferase family 4 protein [Parcubacteria group bacterium]
MKILIITQKYDKNDSNLGAFVGWWDKLAEKIEKVYVLALEKRSEPTRSNIKVLSMGKENGVGFFGKFFGFYQGLLKTIGKTDAILVHMVPKYVILAAPIALIFRKPIYLWYTGVAAQKQLKFSVIFCQKVFTAHEAAMRVNTPKRIVTGHGIDTNKFKIENLKFKIFDKITILSVGRITPSKGHDLVIKAIADLIKAGYDINLKIVGDVIQKHHQKYADFLKKLAVDSGAGTHVKFTGAVLYEKMPEYFTGTEIIINAVPFFGGLDKVVLEAMASSVVPLTSNNAFLSVFPKDFAPQLVFKENNLEDLKNKLKNVLDKKLYSDESLRYELRNVIIKNHNLDNLIIRIIKEMS